jgi:membrane associated rhomboid family serine protease
VNDLVREAKLRLGIPLGLVLVMWMVEGVNLIAQGALLSFGIHPRTPDGLWGIIAAPFLHAGIAHLLANTVPFLVLGWLVALRGLRELGLVTLLVMLVGGGAVWLFGRPFSTHVGASGVIFGYLGFLLARGVIERSAQAIILSLVALVLYGGALWGVIPGSSRISWESHLFGFLSGILAARVLRSPRRSAAPSRGRA